MTDQSYDRAIAVAETYEVDETKNGQFDIKTTFVFQIPPGKMIIFSQLMGFYGPYNVTTNVLNREYVNCIA